MHDDNETSSLLQMVRQEHEVPFGKGLRLRAEQGVEGAGVMGEDLWRTVT